MSKNIIQKGIIIAMLIMFIMPNIFADWVIPAQGEPGVLVMDENGYAHWGDVRLQIENTTISQQFVNYKTTDNPIVLAIAWFYTVLGFFLIIRFTFVYY